MPAPFDRCATLSISSLPLTGADSIPASLIAGPLVSSMVLRSTRLSWDGSPMAAPLSVTPMKTPPPFSVTALSTTVLPLEPWIATPSLLDLSMWLPSTRLPLDLSIQTPSLLLPAISLPRTTVSCVALVSQTPMLFANTELFRSVLPLTPDWYVGGGGAGAGCVG